jgi:hypothetical protein
MPILFRVVKSLIGIQFNKSTKTLKDFTTLIKIGFQLNKSTKTLKDVTTLNKIGIQLNKSQNYILEKLYPKQQRLWSKTRGVFRVVTSFNVFVDLLS